MEQRMQQLEKEVREVKEMLSITGMPYALKEIMRNEVIKQEDNITTGLTQVYTDSGGATLTGPKAYAGRLIFKWKGREYKVPYITT